MSETARRLEKALLAKYPGSSVTMVDGKRIVLVPARSNDPGDLQDMVSEFHVVLDKVLCNEL